ncbi:MAG: DinB family protein [candidate division Zixibacteria bacterium]
MTATLRQFNRFKSLRRAIIGALDKIPPDMIETIPDRLRNNIHWQAGHIVTVQMSLSYRRSGLPMPVSDEWLSSFGKGTSPADWETLEPGLTIPSYRKTRKLLDDSIDQMSDDMERLLKTKYPEPVTVTSGLVITSFAEALEFLPVHEALHLGSIRTMHRLLENF